ncbi:hypothetical protein EZ449_01225 [Pedobacter frigidisoli]|uniref:YhhN-like protein n=1 Tax=Pedobacter frigidisoli TaxID=2530455 RepID=A0A4R0PAD2_9SPHI|nr:hypothetical protein [Pedobacter frigidisoli]TCD12694.1 hypothetical protein EZ449_01225 [Pedobacter frigidisoli]
MRIISPIIIAELFCLIAAIFLLSKDKIKFWKVNIAYLCIALITESYGSYLSSKSIHNIWWYNSFILLEVAFIFYGLYHCLKEYINPKPLIFGGLGISYAIFITYAILDGYTTYANTTVTVMSVIFVAYCLYYYYLLLKDERVVELKYHPEFWWITAVLFYYFGGTTSNLFYWILKFEILKNFPLRLIIFYITNIILCSIWIYTYICRAKQRKLQS